MVWGAHISPVRGELLTQTCVCACARACRMEVKESFLEEVMSKRSLLGAGQVKKSEQHSKPSRPPMHLCEGQEHWEAESI